jgi:DNA-binding XRE family transcriptional regulator
MGGQEVISRKALFKRFEAIDALLKTIDEHERVLDGLLNEKDGPTLTVSVMPPPPAPAPALPSAETFLKSMSATKNEAALAKELAERIKEARKAKGWRQQDLADVTGIARPNIARIESGRRMPKIGTLQRIGQALELAVESMVS